MAQPRIGAQASRLTKDLSLQSSSATTTIPKLVYGTAWKKRRTQELVYTALKHGFRGIDTAAQPKHYDEHGVKSGLQQALDEGFVQREDLFFQTKFSPPAAQGDMAPYSFDSSLQDMVHQSIQSSLSPLEKNGQSFYLDSVVLHSPFVNFQDTLTVWQTLEQYHPHQIRNLGISNTSLNVLKALYNQATVKPAVVQNRFHDRTGYEVELREFCRSHGIVFQSFWTLSANPALARSPPVAKIAQSADVPTVAAYYSLVLGLEGITILDGTTSEAHMKDDLEGIEKVGLWAEGEGAESWDSALAGFKHLIGQL